MTVTCHQTNPIHGSPDENIEEIARLIVNARSDLHVFTELALTGYQFNTCQDLESLAQPLSGSLVARLAELARLNQTAICTGFMEEANGKFYNSAILLDRLGKLVCHYRKVHLFDREKLLFASGDLGFPVGALKIRGEAVKVGMMICYDWRFPEAARTLAINGAQLVCAPSNIITTSPMRMPVRQTRAFENKIYLAFADRVGEEHVVIDGKDSSLLFQGCSAMIAPNGDILDSLSPTELGSITSTIEPAMTIKKSINSRNDIIADRRPEAYR